MHEKYRKSIKILSKSTRYRIFRPYRYFKNDPIPDTLSTRYRFRPISNCYTSLTFKVRCTPEKNIFFNIRGKVLKICTLLYFLHADPNYAINFCLS